MKLNGNRDASTQRKKMDGGNECNQHHIKNWTLWLEICSSRRMTAKFRREAHPDLKRNIRDNASINELICLSNMKNINVLFINQEISQSERLV